MKKGFIITASILVVVGLIIFSAAFIASGFDFSKLGSAKYETNTYSPGESFDKIEIESTEADIGFIPATDGENRVVCEEREKVRHEVKVENGTLKITTVDTRTWLDRLMPFSFKNQSLKIYLTGEHYSALKISAGTGDLSISPSFSFDDADIKTSTGDVAFYAWTDGLLKIHTSTGDIKIGDIRAKNVDLSVSTGKIEGVKILCDENFIVNVSTGKTVLEWVVCKNLSSDGSTGDITLKNSIISDEQLIERGTGDVLLEGCDAGQISVTTSTGDVSGTLYSDKIFIVKTSTGKVSVPDTVSGGTCRITTSTGDINISLIAKPD